MEDQNKILDKIKKLSALAFNPAINEETKNEATVAGKMARRLAHDLLGIEEDKLTDFLKNLILQVEKENGTGEFYSPILNVLGKTIIENPFIRQNAKTVKRILWFEDLAKVIAQNYFCVVGVKEDGIIELYGFAMEREIASFVIAQIAENANKFCKMKMKEQFKKVGTIGIDLKTKEVTEFPKTWMGNDTFSHNFHSGFKAQLESNYLKEKEEKIDDSDATKQIYSKIADDVVEYFNYNFDPQVRHYYGVRYPSDKYNSFDYNESSFELGKSAARFSAKNLNRSNSLSNVESNSKALVSNKKIEHIGDVFLEIDVSGSMSGNKLQQAKDGAIDFAKEVLSKGYKVGLISFSDDAKLISDLTTDLGQFQIAVSRLEIECSTYINEALDLGIKSFKSKLVKRALAICTDGQTAMQQECIKLADIAKLDGIEIITIGTIDADLEFLNRISSKTSKELFEDCNLRKAIGGMALLLTSGE